MKHSWKKLLVIFALLLAFSFAFVSRADFGDFSGDSDFGSYDSGGWDSSDSGWDSDWGDSDWGSSSSGWDSGPVIFYGGGGGAASSMLTLIIGAIILYRILQAMKAQQGSHGQPVSLGNLPRPRGEDISTYVRLDPNFDRMALQEQLANRYVQMQNAWQNQDIEPLKPYFTDAFYNQMNRQLQQMKAQGRTNYMERIAVLRVEPRTWYQENGMDHIVVQLETRMVDYTVDNATGAVVSGNRNREKFLGYEWDLSRKSGVLTGEAGGVHRVNCPACGAPLDINATAKCPYCGSVVTVQQEEWALSSIKGLYQRTM